MLARLISAVAAAAAASLSQAQVPCTGWSLDNELQPFGAQLTVGHNGPLVAVYSALSAPISLGAVSIHRTLEDGTGVTLEGHFAQSGLGSSAAAFTFGCAISNDAAVLLARKNPWSVNVELIEIRRSGSVWSARSFQASGFSSVQKSRHFHSDGNTAAVALQGTTPMGSRILVDIVTVDRATGEWYVEDTVDAGPAGALGGYAIGDVTVRGNRITLRQFNSRRATAWERVTTGQWEEVALPSDVVGPSGDLWKIAMEGEVLASLHGPAMTPRVDVRERDVQGGWTLMSSSTLSLPITSGPLHFALAGERIAFQPEATRVEVLRRATPTTLVTESIVDGVMMALQKDVLVAYLPTGAGFMNVVPLDDLATGLLPCLTAGRNVCTGQRGGALRFLPGSSPNAAEVLLTDAPANSMAVLFGQGGFSEPATPTLGGLCLTSSLRVTAPPIRTAGDGSGIWSLDPGNLSTAFGTTSYIGRTIALQSLVRTPAGAASTDAIWVQL
ncbi:hypothetical protein Poly30_02570 [Planctomycetes bacterium Poly30]|uniref:Uncharacterized protein n=1 Tax=Saltatorellus ferox TaxID=2528018 RepID=A0A518EKZ0_9BACT|nr:hypothetical protein Poly30_02570 [Planctomycetes bacterium Poly30]